MALTAEQVKEITDRAKSFLPGGSRAPGLGISHKSAQGKAILAARGQQPINQTTDRFAFIDPVTGLRTNTPPATPPAPTVPTTPPVETTVPFGNTFPPTFSTPTSTDANMGFFAGVQTNLDTARKALEDNFKQQLDDLKTQQKEAQERIDQFTSQQEDLIQGDIQTALTPFREQLENAERERLFINENFQANQLLTNELETLLTEGNSLIQEQRAKTGLSAIRDPRVAKTVSDISARAGVLNSVMAARNNQIAQAYNLIDRSVQVINADRNDSLNYYNTLLNFYQERKDAEGKKLVTLDKRQEEFLNAQINLLESDLLQSQETAEYIKGLMISPSSALFIAEAGISLNDSPIQINQKLAVQTQRQQVIDTTNEYVEAGYTPVPFPQTGQTDLITIVAGGQNLSFRNPPVTSNIGDSSEGGRVGTLGEIDRVNRAGLGNADRSAQDFFLSMPRAFQNWWIQQIAQLGGSIPGIDQITLQDIASSFEQWQDEFQGKKTSPKVKEDVEEQTIEDLIFGPQG